jgi:hypothetical protein
LFDRWCGFGQFAWVVIAVGSVIGEKSGWEPRLKFS